MEKGRADLKYLKVTYIGVLWDWVYIIAADYILKCADYLGLRMYKVYIGFIESKMDLLGNILSGILPFCKFDILRSTRWTREPTFLEPLHGLYTQIRI